MDSCPLANQNTDLHASLQEVADLYFDWSNSDESNHQQMMIARRNFRLKICLKILLFRLRKIRKVLTKKTMKMSTILYRGF